MSKKSTEVNIAAMYKELDKLIKAESDTKQILKTCNKIIHTKEGKQEITAMKIKVVCLIHMNQFEEAIKFISTTPEIQEHTVFEKAYCYYREQKLSAALETICETDVNDLRTLELKAQIYYKLGRYSECVPIYKKLMKECSDENEKERMTNFIAVNASLSMFENNKTHLNCDAETHEQFFNLACIKLGEGDYKAAKVLLEKAQHKVENYDDWDEDEVESELAPIKVQLAYTMQMLGKEEESLILYNQIIKMKPSDVALMAVTSNNIITINRETNMFDSRKRVKATAASGVENKLVHKQLKKIDLNRALIYMYSNQMEQCKDLLKSIKIKYEGEEMTYLIQAAMLCKEKSKAEAIVFLKNYMNQMDNDEMMGCKNTSIKLIIFQLLLQTDQIKEACDLLESMDTICYKPAAVSLLVTLYNKLQNEDAISDLFERAIDFNMQEKIRLWEEAKQTKIQLVKEDNRSLKLMMWKCSLFHLKKKQNQNAAKILENMLRLDPKNPKIIAQLIFAYSHINQDKAHNFCELLPSLEELSIDVDVDKLEASAIQPRYVKRVKEKEQLTVCGDFQGKGINKNKSHMVSEKGEQILKNKKKKKKKNPTPKNFQKGFVADPERWIPLRERSTYKKRRKDKRKIMKGPQGTASSNNAENQYDMSVKVAGSSQNVNQKQASTSSTPISSPKPTIVKTNKNKKKKKKNGRW